MEHKRENTDLRRMLTGAAIQARTTERAMAAAQRTLEDAFKPLLRAEEQASMAAYRQRQERKAAAAKLGLDPQVWDEYESACIQARRDPALVPPPNPITDLGAWERWQHAQRWLNAAGRR